ncbi:hypothetical protein TNIN_114711 [Trichonephila inaurata madagascariensis]|uniref:Uncharacterized protein n=1 Tax=Trichonephila inaurata madagascariensis TaxID=2747483 RepID=A0A8X7C3K2_9ARAC|nr:hypothetical protein TNIN_114711 [Trichonephila inaurata madagascariensis]
MDKKSFSKHIKFLSEENSEVKHQILEVTRNRLCAVHSAPNDEENKETGLFDVTVSFDGSWQSGIANQCRTGVVSDLLTALSMEMEAAVILCGKRFIASVKCHTLPGCRMEIESSQRNPMANIREKFGIKQTMIPKCLGTGLRSAERKAIKDNCKMDDENEKCYLRQALIITSYRQTQQMSHRQTLLVFQKSCRNRELQKHSIMKTKLTEEVVAKISLCISD